MSAVTLTPGEWFDLPRLGPDTFRELTRAGLRYDRATRRFRIEPRTNVRAVTQLLSQALGRPVEVQQAVQRITCFIEGSDVECGSCGYVSVCRREAAHCLCPRHRQAGNTPSEYRSHVDAQLAAKVKAALHPGGPAAVDQALSWVEKYRPHNVRVMVGNEPSRLAFLEWLAQWTAKSKPALLLGPPGTGKTTLVHAAAAEFGYTVFELNASDIRTKNMLTTRLGPSLTSTSVLGERRLLFLDEVDGLDGRADWGGLEYLRDLAKHAPGPLVFAANAEASEIVTKLAGENFRGVQLVHFYRLHPRQLELYLRWILEREGEHVPLEALEPIVRAANGDVRAAINSLQAAVGQLRRGAPVHGVRRDEQLNLTEAFRRVLAAESLEQAVAALRACEEGDVRTKVRTAFYTLLQDGGDAAAQRRALRALAELDRVVGRMLRGQKWSLLRYVDRWLAEVVWGARQPGWQVEEHDPAFWSQRFRIWNDARVLRAFGRALGAQLHLSWRRTLMEVWPYVALLGQLERTRWGPLREALAGAEESAARVWQQEGTVRLSRLPAA